MAKYFVTQKATGLADIRGAVWRNEPVEVASFASIDDAIAYAEWRNSAERADVLGNIEWRTPKPLQEGGGADNAGSAAAEKALSWPEFKAACNAADQGALRAMLDTGVYNHDAIMAGSQKAKAEMEREDDADAASHQPEPEPVAPAAVSQNAARTDEPPAIAQTETPPIMDAAIAPDRNAPPRTKPKVARPAGPLPEGWAECEKCRTRFNAVKSMQVNGLKHLPTACAVCR